jgi:two-component system response regulator RegX3
MVDRRRLQRGRHHRHCVLVNRGALLCRNEGKALSREQVMNDVWGVEYYGTQRSLDSFVAALRARIEKKASKPDHILTVHGVGYKFVK